VIALWWKIIRRSCPISFALRACHLFLSSSLPPSLALPQSQSALLSQGVVHPQRQDSLEHFLCDFFLPRCLSKERPLSRLDVRDSSSSSSRRLLLQTSPPPIFVTAIVIATTGALRCIAMKTSSLAIPTFLSRGEEGKEKTLRRTTHGIHPPLHIVLPPRVLIPHYSAGDYACCRKKDDASSPPFP
jgi:hypothetical protein